MFSVIFPNFKENLFCKLLLLYFLLFNLNETCVWCILIFISKFVLPRLFFFQLRLPLLLNMQKQSKNYERVKSEETKKSKKQKKVLNSKKEFARVHSFMMSKKSKVGTSISLFPSRHKDLDLRRSHSWTSLIRIQTPLQFNFAQLFLC